MKTLGYIVLVLLCAILESALPRLFGLDLVRPLLVVVVVLHFALKLNTIEGALLALLAGFVVDATAGYPTGLASFTCVALFVGARLALGGLRADGKLFEGLFSFVLAFSWHLVTTALERVLGPNMSPLADTPWMRIALWSSLATLVASPFVMGAAKRIEKLEKRPAGSL